MIIVFLSIAAIAAGAWAVFQTSKTKKLENSLIDKSSIVYALQAHSETVEFDLLKAKLEINTLKSNVQSLNDKAKAASKMKAEKVSVKAITPIEVAAVSNKTKKVYKKKSKVTA
jgi:hypothetical protein